MACQSEGPTRSSDLQSRSPQSRVVTPSRGTTLGVDGESQPLSPLEDSEFTLSLEWVKRDTNLYRVRLKYKRPEPASGARTAEIFIEYPPTLQLTQITPLEATKRAAKDLIVQHPASGRLRLILMSMGSLSELESGPLAELSFQGQAPARSALHIISSPSRPWFAPPAANQGLRIPEPLLLGEQ